jgi:hypothetical protein
VLASRTIESNKASRVGLAFCATLFVFGLQGRTRLRIATAIYVLCLILDTVHTRALVFLWSLRVEDPVWYRLREQLNAGGVYAEEATVCRERHAV